MSYPASLPLQPLLPVLSPVGRPEPDAEAVRSRAGVEYYELQIRDILN